MKPIVRGKNIALREVAASDAEFILRLRTNPEKNKYLSHTPFDVEKQREYILSYMKSLTDYYFIIMDWQQRSLGTIRIYDIREDSFCWGSWIVSDDAPKTAGIESVLLMFDFAFYSLHYPKCHFDARIGNERVVNFYQRLGAKIIREDEKNYYFDFDSQTYARARDRYRRFLP